MKRVKTYKGQVIKVSKEGEYYIFLKEDASGGVGYENWKTDTLEQAMEWIELDTLPRYTKTFKIAGYKMRYEYETGYIQVMNGKEVILETSVNDRPTDIDEIHYYMEMFADEIEGEMNFELQYL
jgi:hypothetical protein